MDNPILKSKLSYWFLHKIIAIYILFSFLSICTCIDDSRKAGDYHFDFSNLPYHQIWILLILIVILLIQWISKKEITIDKSKEVLAIKTFLSKKIRNYSLTQITNMTWENKNTTYNLRYRKESSNQKSFCVSFNDGYVLEAEGTEYTNFFELQGYFLTYCNNHDIIEIAPLSERKKSRFRRKNRHV